MSKDPQRFLTYLEAERKAALLYRSLAETTTGDRREALMELADIEEQHAGHWLEKCAEYGVDVPPTPTSLNPDDAQLLGRARSLGLVSVLDQLEESEGAAAGMYDDEPEALSSMPSEERGHAEVFRAMRTDDEVASTGKFPHRIMSPGEGEQWHRVDKSGAQRAAIFGVSDGLVSNTALVMGFAGANAAGALESSAVLFAGLAGLLAGAFSMAAGEFVSVASQRDLYNREISMEARELAEKPEQEQKELELIYRAKGLSKEDAARIAAAIMTDPKVALDTLAREELGLDPDELGSPKKSALFSLIAFALGASVVVIPYLFLTGMPALILAIVLSVISLLVVGGFVGRISGRGVVFSALRQLAWGAGAAGITYIVGSIIGVNVG